MGLQIH